MGGSVLSFLKAEWKVSDTGSAHWASSWIWQEDGAPLANGALCLNTPKHNGKSGTVSVYVLGV
jgi:hypothetical protein